VEPKLKKKEFKTLEFCNSQKKENKKAEQSLAREKLLCEF
jgi:hypothetical protein